MITPHIQRPRRIVTGHDASGQSIILSDGDAPVMVQAEHSPTMGMAEIWRSTAQLPSNDGDEDGALLPFSLAPASGLIARVVHFPPDDDLGWSASDAKKAFEQFGGGETIANHGARHPAFHRTQSLDFAIVMEGEIWALLDVGETLMQPGDILVQRGTRHAWANRSDKPCRVFFVGIKAAEQSSPALARTPAAQGVDQGRDS